MIGGAAAAVPTPTEKGVLAMDIDVNMILSIIILIILADIIKSIKNKPPNFHLSGFSVCSPLLGG